MDELPQLPWLHVPEEETESIEMRSALLQSLQTQVEQETNFLCQYDPEHCRIVLDSGGLIGTPTLCIDQRTEKQYQDLFFHNLIGSCIAMNKVEQALKELQEKHRKVFGAEVMNQILDSRIIPRTKKGGSRQQRKDPREEILNEYRIGYEKLVSVGEWHFPLTHRLEDLIDTTTGANMRNIHFTAGTEIRSLFSPDRFFDNEKSVPEETLAQYRQVQRQLFNTLYSQLSPEEQRLMDLTKHHRLKIFIMQICHPSEYGCELGLCIGQTSQLNTTHTHHAKIQALFFGEEDKIGALPSLLYNTGPVMHMIDELNDEQRCIVAHYLFHREEAELIDDLLKDMYNLRTKEYHPDYADDFDSSMRYLQMLCEIVRQGKTVEATQECDVYRRNVFGDESDDEDEVFL